MENTRLSIPSDLANTPDSLIDFFIRVTRLKIEAIEGDIINQKKQLDDMRIILKNDPNNSTLINSINALQEICKTRIYAKKTFKSALIKLQQQGKHIFGLEKEDPSQTY